MFFRKKQQLTPARIILIGFALLILAGALLLTMPISTRDGQGASFFDALFTATSATCVTGLVVQDTAQYWSGFGQAVIIVLIQIGGMGVVTVAVAISMLAGRRIGLKERWVMQESISAPQVGGIVRRTRFILAAMLLLEGAGALLLASRFCPEMGLRGIWYAVFHAISSFCNAGFDLMGGQTPYSSFVAYYDDWLVNFVIMSLIIIGGIGFIVWDDLSRNKLHFRKYMLQTKIVLVTTAILVFGGGLLFYLLERNHLLVGMNTSGKILTSLFSSVTARTAGFNTTDTAALTDGSKLLTIILMFIGGSPGSTAGGIKTTTLVVLLLCVHSNIKQTYGINIFGRRLENDAVKRAGTILTINLLLAVTASLAIMAIQPLGFSDILFETFSAIGTVGMTTGITRALHPISRCIIILLMYCGRIGSLSFALAFVQSKRKPHVQQPAEAINIG